MLRSLKESEIIISTGPAGTGKTFLAVAVALNNAYWIKK